MPKQATITRETILEGALAYVKSEGIESITARKLSAYLNCSTQPIYSYFQNMEVLRDEIYAFVLNKLKLEMHKESEDPYMQLGLGIVMFAKKEPELFRLLYFTNRKRKLNLDSVVEVIKSDEHVSKKFGDDIKLLHDHLSVYTHGLACFVMDQPTLFDEETIKSMLTTASIAFGKELA